MEQMQIKLEQVLNKFWEPNCGQEYYSVFLEHVDKIESFSTKLTNTSIFLTKWIDTTLTKLENGPGNKEILKLVLDLIGILCQNEEKVFILHRVDASVRVLNILAINYKELEFYKHSYINMLVCLSKTDIGLECLSTTINIWKHLLFLTNTNTSEEFIQQCVIFFSNIHSKLSKLNKLFCLTYFQPMNTFHNICKKISNATWNENLENDIIIELTPLLELMNRTNLHFCKTVKNGEDLKCSLEFTRLNNYEMYIFSILKFIKTSDLTLKFSKLLISMQFYEILGLTDFSDCKTHSLAKTYIQKIIDIINLNIERGFIKNVIQLCDLGIIFTKCMSIADNFKPLNFCDKPFLFESQLLFIQVMPIYFLSLKALRKRIKHIVQNDVVRSKFHDKVIKQIHPIIIHTMYSFRELLMEKQNVEDDIQITLECILKTTDLYSKDSAIHVFQTLVYVMQDSIIWLTEGNGMDPNNEDFSSLFTMVLNVLVKLIEKYEVNWTDCLETIDLMDIALDFLKFTFLTSKLVTKGLKLIEICISKFMSPNLALLIDSNESGMNFLCPYLYSKLHDKNVEIKKGALDVLLVMSENAKIKYPYFQKVLLEMGIPELIIQIIYNEEDSLCKISALKCTEKIILIDNIWSLIYNKLNIPVTFLNMLKSRMDSNILSEVINVVTTIYDQDYFSEEQIAELYSNMCMFTVDEFNIITCVNVLNFWEKAIKKLLQEEGMIDNVFPEVTFSKQLRKIVVLDNLEIKKRLNKVMKHLSHIGCLGVLSDYLKNESCVDIFKNTLRISKYLVNLLNEYDVQCDTNENVSCFAIDSDIDNIMSNYDFSGIDSTFLSVFLNNNLEPDILNTAKISPKNFLCILNDILENIHQKCDPLKQLDLLLDTIINQDTDLKLQLIN